MRSRKQPNPPRQKEEGGDGAGRGAWGAERGQVQFCERKEVHGGGGTVDLCS